MGPSGGVLPTSGPGSGATVMLDARQTVDLWRTGVAQGIASDPRGVAQSAARGARSSSARTGLAGALVPGYIAG
jgi:hypothetical protein